MTLWIAKIVAVVLLLGIASVLSTPRGRLPIALRGVLKIIRKDVGRQVPIGEAMPVPTWKRCLAFILVIVAAVICVVK